MEWNSAIVTSMDVQVSWCNISSITSSESTSVPHHASIDHRQAVRLRHIYSLPLTKIFNCRTRADLPPNQRNAKPYCLTTSPGQLHGGDNTITNIIHTEKKYASSSSASPRSDRLTFLAGPRRPRDPSAHAGVPWARHPPRRDRQNHDHESRATGSNAARARRTAEHGRHRAGGGRVPVSVYTAQAAAGFGGAC